MEDLARAALGLNPPPAPRPSPRPNAPRPRLTRPPSPLRHRLPLRFSMSNSASSSWPMVPEPPWFSPRTPTAPGGQQKFVTLIGQPDLYGNVAVLLKNVTDAAHLDDTPRMRLVDAVDAMADNRGDLLFELRGATQRQFALYRVLRGDATRIFLSTAESTGPQSRIESRFHSLKRVIAARDFARYLLYNRHIQVCTSPLFQGFPTEWHPSHCPSARLRRR